MNIKPVAEFYYNKNTKRLTIICQPVNPSYPLGPSGMPVEDVFIKREELKDVGNKVHFPFKRKGIEQEEVHSEPKQLPRKPLSGFEQRQESLQRGYEGADTFCKREVPKGSYYLHSLSANEKKI